MSASSKSASVTEKEVQEFRGATLTETLEMPLTFPTKYRHQEFELLRGLEVDFHQLLHLEQAYHYFESIQVGEKLEISSRVIENKIKKGMQFITLETEISSAGVRKVISESKMVVRLRGESEG